MEKLLIKIVSCYRRVANLLHTLLLTTTSLVHTHDATKLYCRLMTDKY